MAENKEIEIQEPVDVEEREKLHALDQAKESFTKIEFRVPTSTDIETLATFNRGALEYTSPYWIEVVNPNKSKFGDKLYNSYPSIITSKGDALSSKDFTGFNGYIDVLTGACKSGNPMHDAYIPTRLYTKGDFVYAKNKNGTSSYFKCIKTPKGTVVSLSRLTQEIAALGVADAEQKLKDSKIEEAPNYTDSKNVQKVLDEHNIKGIATYSPRRKDYFKGQIVYMYPPKAEEDSAGNLAGFYVFIGDPVKYAAFFDDYTTDDTVISDLNADGLEIFKPKSEYWSKFELFNNTVSEMSYDLETATELKEPSKTVQSAVGVAEAAGYREFKPTDTYKVGDKVYFKVETDGQPGAVAGYRFNGKSIKFNPDTWKAARTAGNSGDWASLVPLIAPDDIITKFKYSKKKVYSPGDLVIYNKSNRLTCGVIARQVTQWDPNTNGEYWQEISESQRELISNKDALAKKDEKEQDTTLVKYMPVDPTRTDIAVRPMLYCKVEGNIIEDSDYEFSIFDALCRKYDSNYSSNNFIKDSKEFTFMGARWAIVKDATLNDKTTHAVGKALALGSEKQFRYNSSYSIPLKFMSYNSNIKQSTLNKHSLISQSLTALGDNVLGDSVVREERARTVDKIQTAVSKQFFNLISGVQSQRVVDIRLPRAKEIEEAGIANKSWISWFEGDKPLSPLFFSDYKNWWTRSEAVDSKFRKSLKDHADKHYPDEVSAIALKLVEKYIQANNLDIESISNIADYKEAIKQVVSDTNKQAVLIEVIDTLTYRAIGDFMFRTYAYTYSARSETTNARGEITVTGGKVKFIPAYLAYNFAPVITVTPPIRLLPEELESAKQEKKLAVFGEYYWKIIGPSELILDDSVYISPAAPSSSSAVFAGTENEFGAMLKAYVDACYDTYKTSGKGAENTANLFIKDSDLYNTADPCPNAYREVSYSNFNKSDIKADLYNFKESLNKIPNINAELV